MHLKIRPSCSTGCVQRFECVTTAFAPRKPTFDWARRFILFHDKRHPKDMGADEVQSFLSYFVVERNVASSIQNQVKSQCCSV
ncbi:MAG: Phage integrase, N-terminal SAM-like domain [Candidatus Nitrotoga sp. SPKER]|nr:MAG: Phage integrase, N-terminal SAM-like domain [Candidatus Nitrotoga sp. SPKER]